MQTHPEYRRFAILYVDDEEMSLRGFERAFGAQFRILTARSAADGLEIIQKQGSSIAVLMTDQRMPGEKGVWLLEQTRRLYPRILRILVTAYADMDAAVAAVNSGAIYKYVHKPWDPPALEVLLRRALDFHALERERDQLVKEKLAMLRNLTIADRLLSLGLLAAGLSHHIRNALVSVKTFLDLAPSKLEGEGLDPRQLRQPDFWTEYLGSVQGQIDRITRLLRDLWLASETPAFEFKDTISLRQVVAMSYERLQDQFKARAVAFQNDIPEDLPQLTVDHKRFSRLFDLLLEDELVSLPEGSRVKVRAQPEKMHPAHRCVRVEIEDDGPGLPQDAMRILFDPFVVRSDSPSEFGIRLMACFFIVHQHGGKIIARSAQDRGTTFILKLPLNPADLSLAEENQMFLEKLFFNEEAFEKHLNS
jgi:two-component system probable response regulator PhcQ